MTTGLAICDTCGIEAADDDLETCALSVPWAPIEHCAECAAECGPCRDEARQEWAAEHYGLRTGRA